MALRKQYKTARGRTIDIEALRQLNEKTVAVGNLGGPGKNVNSRGDILDKDGKVLKKREQIVREYYRSNIPKVREQAIQDEIKSRESKPLVTPQIEVPETFDDPEEAIRKIKEAHNKGFKEPKLRRKKKTTE